MSGKDNENGNLPKDDVTRRSIFTLATAVATFGVAMGMRASTAFAAAKKEETIYMKFPNKREGGAAIKAEGKSNIKGEGKVEIKSGKGERREGKIQLQDLTITKNKR